MLYRFRERLEASVQSLYQWTISGEKLSKRFLVMLFSFGLAIRIPALALLGNQDMEHYKAWTSYVTQNSVVTMYAGSDAEILSPSLSDLNLWGKFQKTATVFRFEPLAGYFRTEYKVMYPPLSIYLMKLSGLLYQRVDPTLSNTRIFNVFINIIPLLASMVLTLLVWKSALLLGLNQRTAIVCALFLWLNPALILDSPIQGYYDSVLAIGLLGTLMLLYDKKPVTACFVFGLTLMIKPQAFLLAPVIFVVCLKETKRFIGFILCLLGGLLAMTLVLLPFFISGHTISGVFSVFSTLDLTGWHVEKLSNWASLNLWWAFQAPIKVLWEVVFKGTPLITASNGMLEITLDSFRKFSHIEPKLVGYILLGGFTLLNVFYLWKHLSARRDLIFLASFMQFYTYAMLQVEVHNNHIFYLVPLLAMFLIKSPSFFGWNLYFMIIVFIQLFVTSGFGRDLPGVYGVFDYFGLAWLLNLALFVIAVSNVIIYAKFNMWLFTSAKKTG